MVLNSQQCNKVVPLISHLEAYKAFIDLLEMLHEQYYQQIRDSKDSIETHQAQGKLQLIDELQEIRERVKDSIENGRLSGSSNSPLHI